MQLVEMLKEKSAFDEMGGFCKNCPIHRRVFGQGPGDGRRLVSGTPGREAGRKA